MSTNDHAQLINRNEPNQHMAKAIVYGGEPLNKQLDAMKATIAERPTTDEVADGYYNKGEVDSQLAGKAGTDHGELLNRDAANQHMATAISYNGAPLDAQLDTMTADIALRPTTAEVADGYYGKSEIDAQMAEKAGTDHNQLSNRDAADQHPAAAITYNGAALDTELDQVRADVTQRPTATEVADNHYSKSEVDTRMANKAGTEAVTLSANGLATPEIQSLVEYGDLALTVVQPVESQPGEITVTCGKIVDGRRYMLTFITPKPFDTADTLVVNGTPTTIRMADGSAPTTGLFASGAQKTAALDTTVAGHYILTFEAGAAVGTYDAVCVTTGARHELTIASFPASLPPTFTVRVTMDANYLAGNTFHIGGTEFAARTQTNDAAPNDVVKAGATIEIVFDTSRGLAFFKAGVGRNGWNISVGGETPVSEGIHVPDAVAPSRVYLDNGFERYSPDIKQVAVGWSHTLILLNSGRVLSCGNNNSGQLGRSTPSGGEMTINLDYIPGLDDVVAIAANYSQSFFIRSNGSVWSCGNNYYGQLGRIIPTGDVSTVNLGAIPDLTDVVQVAAGRYHTHFLLQDGRVISCGKNNCFQLGRSGNSGKAGISNLGQIYNLQNISAIAAGCDHSLFLKTTGEVYSCGYNNRAQIGRPCSVAYEGSSTKSNLDVIPNLPRVKAIVAGDESYSLFLSVDGTAWSCGCNCSGELGRIASSPSKMSTNCNMGQITELTDVIAISAGYRNSFFLISDGTVWSSGWNSNGQLGRAVDNGGPEKSNLATIPGLFDVKEVNAAFSHSLFLNEGGKLFTCGSNDSGQLARKVESGSYTSINLGEVDKSIKDHGAPLPSPEDEGALFIRHVGPDENCRVRVYDDRFIHLYASPVEVFQVENNLAVEKSFEIRKN